MIYFFIRFSWLFCCVLAIKKLRLVYYFNWQPFVRTTVHDHAKNGCLMILLKGELNEKLYDKNLEVIGENNYTKPNISFINDKKGYHSIKALKYSKSLHIYYPKGHNTKSYKKYN